ncbi:MAG: DMT family transporter [Clostridia bacterium]
MKRLLGYKYDIFLLITTLLWGSTFLTTEYILREVDMMTFLWVRNILAAVVLLFIFGRYLRTFTWRALGAAAILGALLFAGGVLQTGGMVFTTPEKSAFITSFQNLFVPFLSLFFLRKKPSIFSVAGLICAFIGMYFITYGSSPLGFAGGWGFIGGWGIGETFTLISAFMWAWYIIFISKFSLKHNAYFMCIVQLAVAGALFGIVSIFTGARPVPNTLSAWLPIIYISVFASAGSLVFMMLGQRHTSPTRAAVIYTMEPVFALIIGLLIPSFDGTYALANAPTLIGGGAIVFGVLVSEIGPLMFGRSPEEAEEAEETSHTMDS